MVPQERVKVILLMNHRESRMPVYFFSTWSATKVKWVEAGHDIGYSVRTHAGPQIKEHLLELKPCAGEGGFIPIPDHRIPPDCTLLDVYEYTDVFNEVFNS